MPDHDFTLPLPLPLPLPISIMIIPTGSVKPAYKRDIALRYAKGEILAFLDDDVYPVKDWLKNALECFNDADVAAVGGPAVTPLSDSLKQTASGKIYSSFFVSGQYFYRYVPGMKREVDDYPSCNLLVRRSIMLELGGFSTDFWPGEDTKLCLDITKKLGKKIIYSPDVFVYHHRRSLYLPHLKQIASYALHRGYFVKRFPETSLRFAYFIPSLFVIFLVFGGLAELLAPGFRIIYIIVLGFYLLLTLIFSIYNKLCLIPLVFFGIILTHIAYGLYFIKGLFSKKLKEEAS